MSAHGRGPAKVAPRTRDGITSVGDAHRRLAAMLSRVSGVDQISESLRT
jgi:hypothetical protein